jgi:hypothetical protein
LPHARFWGFFSALSDQLDVALEVGLGDRLLVDIALPSEAALVAAAID